MTKILATSDWHIGATLHGYDREPDFRHYVERLSELCRHEQPEWLLLAGDVFDTRNPSAAAEQTYFWALQHLLEAAGEQAQMVVIAGNHDNPLRLSAAASFLRRAGVNVVCDIDPERLERNLIPLSNHLVCIALPYVRPTALREREGYPDYNICMQALLRELVDKAGELYPGADLMLMAHTFATGAQWGGDQASKMRLDVGGVESVDLGPFDGTFRRAVIGHIHRHQAVAKAPWAAYVGSAIPTDFGELNYHHGCEVMDFDDKGELHCQFHELTPLRPLLSVPTEAEPLTAVVEALRQLPPDSDDQATTAFVQVNLLDEGADAERENKIRRALEGRKALLCQIRLQQPDRAASAESTRKITTTDVRHIEPIDFLRQLWLTRYGQHMPANVEVLAKKVVAKASE